MRTDKQPPLRNMILEVLAARHRLGEPFWHFDADPSTLYALKMLEQAGLISVDSGMVERTRRASLTAAGRDAMFPAGGTYVSPLESRVRESLTDARRRVLAFAEAWRRPADYDHSEVEKRLQELTDWTKEVA